MHVSKPDSMAGGAESHELINNRIVCIDHCCDWHDRLILAPDEEQAYQRKKQPKFTEDGWCEICGTGAIESGMYRCEKHKEQQPATETR